MFGNSNHKPFEAVQANTAPGRLQSIPDSGLGSANPFAGVIVEQLVSIRGVGQSKAQRLTASSAHPNYEGLPFFQTLGFNRQSALAARTTMSETQRQAKFNYQQFAGNMNRDAVLPMTSIVPHKFQTNRHED
jgi:hypothetical protein